MAYLFVAGTVICTVYGQLIIKWRINAVSTTPAGFYESAAVVLRLLIDPWVLSAFVAAFLAAISWMAAMMRLEVSFAYPLVVAGLIVLTSMAAMLLLGETVTPAKVVGGLLIATGVVVMVLGKGTA